jgi:hypothetical protein
MSFYLDFSDGRCRSTRARTLDLAVSEAIDAAQATNTPCKVLDDAYKCVAEVVWNGNFYERKAT